MNPPGAPWVPLCPVCGRPVGDIGQAPCPRCGLPAAAQAATVVARIGATIGELTGDRDALLATLRAAALGAAGAPPAPAMPVAPPPVAPPSLASPTWAPPPSPWAAPTATAPRPVRRLSPQQVLLGLGALLYAPLLPRWLTLGTAGLLLLVVGATYERRRQQAREAVAWVAQMC